MPDVLKDSVDEFASLPRLPALIPDRWAAEDWERERSSMKDEEIAFARPTHVFILTPGSRERLTWDAIMSVALRKRFREFHVFLVSKLANFSHFFKGDNLRILLFLG